MDIQKGHRIDERHLVGETILLGDEGADVLFKCILENCHIIVDTKDNVIGIRHSKLFNCTLEFNRKLKNARLVSCDYINCTFKGKFDGVDFGRWPAPNPLTKQMDELGDVIDCDFTQSTLDLCRFFGVDIQRQKFAPWPQFVVPRENDLAASKLDRVWPGQFAQYLGLIQGDHPATTALTGLCKDFIKRYAITEEELLQALDDIGGVIK
ncbi:hypothetical protein [Comamonas sp. MYb396]|uniref:hypothetical protein n=1 Tax=Comamonas sp. MYb396 TaxID=2745302 RepID=UPI0030AFB37E